MAARQRSFIYDCSSSRACCNRIEITLQGGVIQEVAFHKGCEGNHRGLVALVAGRKAEEVVSLLEGIQCGDKGTSCPDQLARSLKVALNKSQ